MDINFSKIIQEGFGKEYVFAEMIKNFLDDTEQSALNKTLYEKGLIAVQYDNFDSAFEELDALRNKNTTLTDFEEDALQIFDSVSWTKTIESVKEKANEKSEIALELEKIADKFVSSARELINIGGSITKGKLKITDDKKGIFDFSLASLGLYRPLEFYSQGYADAIQSGERTNQFEFTKEPIGVIPSNNVIRRDGKFIFKQQGLPALECEKRQKGTTAVFNNYADFCFLKEDKQGMVLPYKNQDPNKVFNGGEKAKLKYASTNKKSYLMFEKQSDSAKYVDIFIPVNFTSQDDEGKYVTILPHLLISLILEDFGIQTRILATRNGGLLRGSVSISMTIKNYDEPTKDKFIYCLNIMAEEGFTEKFFNALKVLIQNRGQLQPDGKMFKMNDNRTYFSTIAYPYKTLTNNLFQRYKNWIKINKDKPFAKTKVINPNFQIFPNLELDGYRSMKRAKLNNESIKKYFPIILYNVYYYIDLLAFELNSVAKMQQIIQTRFDEDKVFQSCFEIPDVGKERNELIKNYIIDLLSAKYEIVDEYAYQDDEEEIQKKKNLKEQKISEITEIFA